jgi:D-3-phosphoglycerate dehydrogenase / 2-oxoglutarate reductase
VRVLIADTFEDSGIAALRALGCEVLHQAGLKDQSLVGAVRNFQADVLVVRSTPVGAAVFDAPTLKLVVRAGAGYNTIDVAAASKRGVYVSNCPGKNSIAVAELAFGLMLALDRRIADSVVALRAVCPGSGCLNLTALSGHGSR